MLTNLPRDKSGMVPAAELVSEYVQKSRFEEIMHIRQKVDNILRDARLDAGLDKRTYDIIQARLDTMFEDRYESIREEKYGTDNNP